MTKKALLVGINDYAPAGPGGPDLHGCVNDVKDFANTLGALGIVPILPGSMRILTDHNATRDNILAGLKWLLSGAKSGDVRVFYYSGHGTYVVDVSGDELDRKDESICPHDFATAGPITDDDIGAALAGMPAGVNLDVFLDSCFSGTATRVMMDTMVLGSGSVTARSFTVRFIEPPVDQSIFADAAPMLPVKGILASTRNGSRDAVVVPSLNHVLWSGCRDNELSGEGNIGGDVRGFFTYAFCKCLRGAGLNVTRAKLDSQVSLYLSQMSTSQHPQTEGTKASLREKVFT
jgi:metacaspase-1